MKPFFVLFALSLTCLLPDVGRTEWVCNGGACHWEGPVRRLQTNHVARVAGRYERRASYGSMGGYAGSVGSGSHGGYSASGNGSTGGYSSPQSAPAEAAPVEAEPTTDTAIPVWQTTRRVRAARKCVNGRCACKDCKCGPLCDCGRVAIKELPAWRDEKMVQLPAWNSPQLASI